MDILAHGADEPALARMYRIDWHIVPNIGIDLIMPPLLHVLPLLTAGKIFLALAVLLPYFGIILLHKSLFRVPSYWPLCGALIVYNRLFFLGFLNFEIGVGLALIAAAVWHEMANRPWRRTAVAMIFGIIIFFCHLIALVFYGLLLVGLELQLILAAGRLKAVQILSALAPFLIPAVLFGRAPLTHQQNGPAESFVTALRHYYWELSGVAGLKLIGFFGAFLTYQRVLDAAAAAFVMGLWAMSLARGKSQRQSTLVGQVLLLAAVYPFVPFVLLKTAWIDQRLPIMMTIILIASVKPRWTSPRARIAVVIIFGFLFAARQIAIAGVWRDHDREVAEFRQDIAPVGPNERVLVARPNLNPDRNAWENNADSVAEMLRNDATMHLPALLLIDRRAFWPLLFTAAGKQPVSVQPPYDAIAMPEGITPQVKDLAAPSDQALQAAPYLRHWRETFDWLLVLRPTAVADSDHLLVGQVTLVRRGHLAALYRIAKPASEAETHRP